MVQWEHAAHVSDFQSERGFESRQVQQFFAQRVALRTDTICLPKPSHFTTWNGPLNRKTFGEVKTLCPMIALRGQMLGPVRRWY